MSETKDQGDQIIKFKNNQLNNSQDFKSSINDDKSKIKFMNNKNENTNISVCKTETSTNQQTRTIEEFNSTTSQSKYRHSKFGDQKNNQKLKLDKINFTNQKIDANKKGIHLFEEDQVIKTTESELQIVKNRLNFLRKKIDNTNIEIVKQDQIINKIKYTQVRFLEQKKQLDSHKSENEELNKSNREIVLKRKEDQKRAVIKNKLEMQKQNKLKQETEKKIADNLKLLKKQYDEEQEFQNKKKSEMIKQIHDNQIKLKLRHEERLKLKSEENFNQKLIKKQQQQKNLNKELANMEKMEKALIEEYSRTISKKNEKEKKIKDINDCFKNNDFVQENGKIYQYSDQFN